MISHHNLETDLTRSIQTINPITRPPLLPVQVYNPSPVIRPSNL